MTGQRVRPAYVEQLDEVLSARDRSIIEAVWRFRLITGVQLERLIFPSLTQPSRSVVRRRVLSRLISFRILSTLSRRIGGIHGGSAGLVFALDSAGQYLMRHWHPELATDQRVRRPWTPGQMFLSHTLDVTEVAVRLVETSRGQPFEVSQFVAEPASWVPNGLGGWLKPDAYLVLSNRKFSEAVWLEIDRATEALPTVRRKLQAYLDFIARGQQGPDGVIPRVIITVPNEQRRSAIVSQVGTLANVPPGLFAIVPYEQATALIAGLMST